MIPWKLILKKKEYTCGKWNLKGIPCCHAVVALFYLHKDIESYVDKGYTVKSYLVAYSGSISPLAGERYWPRLNIAIDPPTNKNRSR